jgi:hypothetical protein
MVEKESLIKKRGDGEVLFGARFASGAVGKEKEAFQIGLSSNGFDIVASIGASCYTVAVRDLFDEIFEFHVANKDKKEETDGGNNGGNPPSAGKPGNQRGG